jgi:tetraacyldisaccharide 4'-kinase
LLALCAAPDADLPAPGAAQRFLALVRGQRRGLWPALQRLALRCGSVPYGLAVRARNAAYALGWCRIERATVPVISVGNLTVGGTGKTPCVEYVADFYRAREWRVAILSRGYGSAGGASDEALVLEENLPDVPHLQGPDRVALARAAVEELESEVLVLDDGFQHRRLARNLDIVLIDASDPWGEGYLLPRGLLREPPSSLRRAHAIVLTRTDQVAPDVLAGLHAHIARLTPNAPRIESVHRPEQLVNGDRSAPLAALRDRPVVAFCGIGNPEAFRRTLTDLGAHLTDFRVFPDHHPYLRADVETLAAWAGHLPPDGLVVTTQKDLVKLRPLDRLSGRPLWAVRVRLALGAGREALDRLLEGVAPTGDAEA